jgi:hypothetical protein
MYTFQKNAQNKKKHPWRENSPNLVTLEVGIPTAQRINCRCGVVLL